jgi:hypothetical protein
MSKDAVSQFCQLLQTSGYVLSSGTELDKSFRGLARVDWPFWQITRHFRRQDASCLSIRINVTPISLRAVLGGQIGKHFEAVLLISRSFLPESRLNTCQFIPSQGNWSQ